MAVNIEYLSSTQKKISKNKEQITITLIVILACLLTLGLINLYSASTNINYFYSHIKHIFLGVLIFYIAGWWLSATNKAS